MTAFFHSLIENMLLIIFGSYELIYFFAKPSGRICLRLNVQQSFIIFKIRASIQTCQTYQLTKVRDRSFEVGYIMLCKICSHI